MGRFNHIETYQVGDVVESMVSPENGGNRYEILSFNKPIKRAMVFDMISQKMTSIPFEFRTFELIKPQDRRYNQYPKYVPPKEEKKP
jgi:hypothetical protein